MCYNQEMYTKENEEIMRAGVDDNDAIDLENCGAVVAPKTIKS